MCLRQNKLLILQKRELLRILILFDDYFRVRNTEKVMIQIKETVLNSLLPFQIPEDSMCFLRKRQLTIQIFLLIYVLPQMPLNFHTPKPFA